MVCLRCGVADLDISSNLRVMDVSSRQSVKECGRRLDMKGFRIDVLVNNAAIYPPGDILSVSEETIREAMEINFLGALRTAQVFLPGMLQRNTEAFL